jgi:uncharacterized protein (DUF433 family)
MEYVEQRDGGLYVRGSRVSVDSIVYGFRQGESPETIRQNFPTLTLEQVYGVIAYYLANQERVDAGIREAERMWTDYSSSHPISEDLRNRLCRAREGRTVR